MRDFALAKIERKISRTQYPQHDELRHKFHGSPDDYIRLLESTKKLIPLLASHPMITRSSSPVLWHADLHLGNIFVSAQDPTSVEGIIDWQSSLIAPMFLQCRVPVFLEPPKDYVRGAEAPKLPDDFDQLDTIEQQRAILQRDLATRWKLYEMYTLINNLDVYNALRVDRRLWEPFARCGQSRHDDIVPLRSCLIRVFNDWELLEMSGECPFAFTKDELQMHEKESKQYQDRVYLQNLARDQLRTDDEGWVPLREWEAVRAENQRLNGMFVDTMAGEMSKEEAMKMWPFCDDESLTTST